MLMPNIINNNTPSNSLYLVLQTIICTKVTNSIDFCILINNPKRTSSTEEYVSQIIYLKGQSNNNLSVILTLLVHIINKYNNKY